MLGEKRFLSEVSLLIGLATLLFQGPLVSLVRDCATAERQAGLCSVGATNDGTKVTIGVKVTDPGSSGGSSGPSAEPDPDIVFHRSGDGLNLPQEPGDGLGAVSMEAIRSFRPDPPLDLMQPNGWMLVGLDTNFYAKAPVQVKSGTLLGQLASVRFTPAIYSWTYGDGASRSTHTPGATWKALGLAEFDPTPTSHIYRSPGTYYIDLTVGYRPEYRWAGSTEWIPIDGLIWVPANRLVAVASNGAKTVLVEDDCTANPSGPGC